MKIILCTLLVLLSALSCDKEASRDENCVPVNMVKELCGQAILEILDPAYYDYGQYWEDGTGMEYENVFKTILPCSFNNDLNIGFGPSEPGSEFYIRFTDEFAGGGCVRCEAYLHGPEKFFHIKVAHCQE